MHSGVRTGVIFFTPLLSCVTCALHLPCESFWYENLLMQVSCVKHGAFIICMKKTGQNGMLPIVRAFPVKVVCLILCWKFKWYGSFS